MFIIRNLKFPIKIKHLPTNGIGILVDSYLPIFEINSSLQYKILPKKNWNSPLEDWT